MYCTPNCAHKNVCVCVCLLWVCAHVLRPTERGTLLDAGNSQTETDICQSLSGILPMQLMRNPLFLFSLTHEKRAQARTLYVCVFEERGGGWCLDLRQEAVNKSPKIDGAYPSLLSLSHYIYRSLWDCLWLD